MHHKTTTHFPIPEAFIIFLRSICSFLGEKWAKYDQAGTVKWWQHVILKHWLPSQKTVIFVVTAEITSNYMKYVCTLKIFLKVQFFHIYIHAAALPTI
jgi:hypothetical protein